MTRRARTRRQHLSYLVVAILLCYCITILVRSTCTNLFQNIKKIVQREYLHIPDDVTCYNYKTEINYDNETQVKKNGIYLISTSCESSMSMHHACVLESALHVHGYEKKIYVFVTTPVKECLCSEEFITKIKEMPMIKFVTINIHKFIENTPFKDIFKGKLLYHGLKKYDRVAEILKFAVLFKYGGIVIDFDMVMAKPVNFLGLNWGVKLNNSELGSAAIALSRDTEIGKSLILKSIEVLKKQSESGAVSSGLALTEAFKELCYDKPIKGCSNFRIYEAEYFYPFNKSSSHLMFAHGYLLVKPFGYYVWDRLQVRRSRGSLYLKLMTEYCPNVLAFMEL